MEAAPQPGAGVRVARVGTCVSLLALAGSAFMLAKLETAGCAPPLSARGGSGSIDVSPLALFAACGLALLLDVRAVRRGGRAARWGRIGVAAVTTATILGVWAAAEGFLRAGCT